MPTQIQIRRGTASSWTSANPILALGEQGLETDTRKTKFGDGTTAWNSLAYAASGNGTATGTNTGDETTATIITKLAGGEGKIGESVLPPSAHLHKIRLSGIVGTDSSVPGNNEIGLNANGFWDGAAGNGFSVSESLGITRVAKGSFDEIFNATCPTVNIFNPDAWTVGPGTGKPLVTPVWPSSKGLATLELVADASLLTRGTIPADRIGNGTLTLPKLTAGNATNGHVLTVGANGTIAAQAAGGGGGVSAANTTFTANGSISSTNVQAAIQEVRDEAAPVRQIVTSSTLTAVAGARYSINNAGLCTITDPATGTVGQSYTVIINAGTMKWATGPTYQASRFEVIRSCNTTNIWTTNPPVLSDTLGIASGGTGATTALGARANLDVAEQNVGMRGLANTINLFQSAGDVPISAIFLGDSFAATGSLFNFSLITRVVGGYRTGALIAGGDSGVTTINDYTKSLSGSYLRIADGGNLTCGHLQTGTQAPASHAYYTFFTGTGTAQIQHKKGAAGWTNVGSPIDTTIITTVLIGSIALPDTSSNYAVRVTATGGTVNGWIGQGLNGPGLTVMDFATAGQQIEQSATVDESIWKAMVTGYRVSGGAQIILTAFADHRFVSVATSAWPTRGIPSWGASGPAQRLHTWSRQANSTVDWIVIGPHQVSTASTDAPITEVDAAYAALGIGLNTNDRTMDGSRAQREFAVNNRAAWCDCSLITDYVTGNAEGLYSDTIHFNTKGQDYKRSHLLNQTNLGYVLGPSQQYSALRIGSIRLSNTHPRSGPSALVAYAAGNPDISLAAITGSSMRVGDAINPEQAGWELAWFSTNVARLRSYTAGGPNANGFDFTTTGAGPTFRPTATAGSLNGTSSLPWETTYTQGLVLPPVAQTATAAAVSTVYTTTALTTTAPAQAITLANGNVGMVKIITHVATSGSGTAVLTPATRTGFSTITFTNVGDTVTLQFYTSLGWMIMGVRGATVA